MIKKFLLAFLFCIWAFVVNADPLNVAVRSLDLHLFKQVLENTEEINATDTEGLTPLHHACKLGVVEMASMLLSKGADPKLVSNDGKNALHHAVNIEALCFTQPLETGLTICPLTIPLMLASAGLEINAADADGNTALHLAAKNGLVGVIATLIQAGANPNCRNLNGETPLHLVGGQLPHICAQVLLLNAADPSIKNNSGKKPADLAAEKKNVLLINMINKYGGKKE